MKLTDLMKSYSKAEVASNGNREVLETVNAKVVRAGYNSDGLPYVQIDKQIKFINADGEWSATSRVIMFEDDVDAFKGSFDMRADVIMLNGISAKASILVEGYEDKDGNGRVTHTTNIILDEKNLKELINKCDRVPAPTTSASDNPFA